jgi:hypothetical protein
MLAPRSALRIRGVSIFALQIRVGSCDIHSECSKAPVPLLSPLNCSVTVRGTLRGSTLDRRRSFGTSIELYTCHLPAESDGTFPQDMHTNMSPRPG